MKRLIRQKYLLLSCIIIVGIFLRFYNLNWGAPYYFHPDERNVASLLTQDPLEEFPSYLFKGTFSYGNFPVVFLQLPKFIISSIAPDVDLFAMSILILRIVSFLCSVGTLFVIYKIAELFSKKAGLIAISLAAA